MENQQNLKTLEMEGGKIATLEAFKGKHVFEAQRRVSAMDSSEDSGQLIKVLISMLVKIDGAPIVAEDLDEMNGQDVLKLMGEFTAANFR